MLKTLLCEQDRYIQVNIGDLKFYLIAGILVVALIVILSVFSKSKKFKARKRKKSMENKEVYVTPNIIKVGVSDINKEILKDKEVQREIQNFENQSPKND
ncbi:MAG: hypothetical protein K2G37_02720 [Clostridia bacterium]|nr:hypothetical protein [Clostridia bacterium]MDE7328163.1 hypothetical protein [Clostridia bacterium]